MTPQVFRYEIRNTRPEDFPGIIELCKKVYPSSPPWTEVQLASHHRVFPEGQFVVVDTQTDEVVGMAASLIIRWDEYEISDDWGDFTDSGMFTNHDPEHGRTLYGAEIMVSPAVRRQGLAGRIYTGRRRLAERLGLLRIRAGARLAGYGRYKDRLTPTEYVIEVVQGRLNDPTLSFQLRQGFDVLAVVRGYLRSDPESLGYAAVIEWLNPKVATPADYAGRDPRFRRPATS